MAKIIRMIAPRIPIMVQRKRVCGYARVSSGKDAMLHSLSAQVSYYSDLIQRNPEWVYAGVYVDEALTGTKDDRKDFQRMLADCRAGKIDMVITKSISRFARNTVTLLETVRELKALHVDVYFEEQHIHSMSGDGELMLTILASYAQEESRSVSENCKWSVRKRFEKGIPISHTIIGLKIKRGKVELVEEEAEVIRYIFELRHQGLGRNAITRHLNRKGIPAKNGGIWHDNVVARVLRNEMYEGDLLLQKEFSEDHLTKVMRKNNGELPQYFVQNNHEAIVPRDVFDEVQQSIQVRAPKNPEAHAKRKSYPFTGKLICDNCGKGYRRRLNSGKYKWQCHTYMTRGKDICPAKQIHESILEDVCADVLGLSEFDGSVFAERIDFIRVCSGNRLVFNFIDGHQEERVWIDPSRRDSWTDEMKAQAAICSKRRYDR